MPPLKIQTLISDGFPSFLIVILPLVEVGSRCWPARVAMVLKKAEIEASLLEENKLIQDGKLKEDNPLDLSEDFTKLCEACRRGDLKACQEMIMKGANINARDRFDYTPLILVCTPLPTLPYKRD